MQSLDIPSSERESPVDFYERDDSLSERHTSDRLRYRETERAREGVRFPSRVSDGHKTVRPLRKNRSFLSDRMKVGSEGGITRGMRRSQSGGGISGLDERNKHGHGPSHAHGFPNHNPSGYSHSYAHSHMHAHSQLQSNRNAPEPPQRTRRGLVRTSAVSSGPSLWAQNSERQSFGRCLAYGAKICMMSSVASAQLLNTELLETMLEKLENDVINVHCLEVFWCLCWYPEVAVKVGDRLLPLLVSWYLHFPLQSPMNNKSLEKDWEVKTRTMISLLCHSDTKYCRVVGELLVSQIKTPGSSATTATTSQSKKMRWSQGSERKIKIPLEGVDLELYLRALLLLCEWSSSFGRPVFLSIQFPFDSLPLLRSVPLSFYDDTSDVVALAGPHDVRLQPPAKYLLPPLKPTGVQRFEFFGHLPIVLGLAFVPQDGEYASVTPSYLIKKSVSTRTWTVEPTGMATRSWDGVTSSFLWRDHLREAAGLELVQERVGLLVDGERGTISLTVQSQLVDVMLDPDMLEGCGYVVPFVELFSESSCHIVSPVTLPSLSLPSVQSFCCRRLGGSVVPSPLSEFMSGTVLCLQDEERIEGLVQWVVEPFVSLTHQAAGVPLLYNAKGAPVSNEKSLKDLLQREEDYSKVLSLQVQLKSLSSSDKRFVPLNRSPFLTGGIQGSPHGKGKEKQEKGTKSELFNDELSLDSPRAPGSSLEAPSIFRDYLWKIFEALLSSVLKAGSDVNEVTKQSLLWQRWGLLVQLSLSLPHFASALSRSDSFQNSLRKGASLFSRRNPTFDGDDPEQLASDLLLPLCGCLIETMEKRQVQLGEALLSSPLLSHILQILSLLENHEVSEKERKSLPSSLCSSLSRYKAQATKQEKQSMKEKKKGKLFWAAGTGYATSADRQDEGNNKVDVERRLKQKAAVFSCILSVFFVFFESFGEMEWLEWEQLQEVLKGSCLFMVLETRLREFSPMETVSSHEVFGVTYLIRAILSNPKISSVLLLSGTDGKGGKGGLGRKRVGGVTGESILSHLEGLKRTLDQLLKATDYYMEEEGEEGRREENEGGPSGRRPNLVDTEEEEMGEGGEVEVWRELRLLVADTLVVAGEAQQKLQSKQLQQSDEGGGGGGGGKEGGDYAKAFLEADLVFGEFEILDKCPLYHYLSSARQKKFNKGQVKRIVKETSTLSTNLPIHSSSSIFLRVDSSRLDVLQALITGLLLLVLAFFIFVHKIFFFNRTCWNTIRKWMFCF